MYKLLIVEDELSTRKWFTKVINWEQNGFEVIAIVEDGQQAWEILKERPEVDVVMTDIRMPYMDGLELTERIRSLPGEPVEIVILSGFGEFDYAQQAIKLGVRDYLLKPVTKEQLTEVFEIIARRLDERHLQSTKIQYANQMQKEKALLEKAQIYERWLTRKDILISPERWFNPFDAQLDFVNGSFLMLVAEFDDYTKFTDNYNDEDQKLCRFIVHNILDEITHNYGAVDSVLMPPNRYVFLLEAGSEKAVDHKGLLAGHAFQESLNKYLRLFSVQLSVGCSQQFEGISNVPEAYDQAFKALRHKFFTGKGSVNLFHPSPQGQNEGFYPTELEKRLIIAFKQGDEQGGYRLFNEFLGNMCSSGESEDSIRFIVGEMLVNLFRQLREVKSLPVTSEVMEMFIEEIRRQETYVELTEKAKELIQFMLQSIAIEALSLSPVSKGIEYMKIKLSRDISLQEVAEYVGISASYFSTLFKQEKGYNFVDFLVRLRMEKSLELLERTSLTVAQVGDEVGYQSYRYFTKVFKDYYAMTPTQFRERLKIT
ncbi:two-component system response regulator YesN [Paenibacillus sp. V4I3]|uniref:response regulator n=1 Tax=unclassified Paenibacillus TaxID=185978 RepID=UPI0027823C18|nr:MULTISPECIES: response regulator [unclassified Paenibacillus]MDQ0877272.1 two-component system response regulator YesN [Paenibacillus sp. V4I3]MDQ0886861.1 two-component system response regulator YesN [Paenibacillus sp. V4I9]